MSLTVALVHADRRVADLINREFSLHIPYVDKFNILDDSLFFETIQNGMTPRVLARLVEHYTWCEQMGADVILNTSSVLDPAVNICRSFVATPVMRINEPMCERALSEGHRICILGSLDRAIQAVAALLMEVSARGGHTLHLVTRNVPDAVEQLDMGDWDMHNRLIAKAVHEMAGKCDAVIVSELALLPLLPLLKREVDVPVFGSAELIVARLARMAREKSPTPAPEGAAEDQGQIETVAAGPETRDLPPRSDLKE